MMSLKQFCAASRVALATLIFCVAGSSITAQQLDEATVIKGVGAAVKARLDNVLGYTVTEHYAVYRSGDETHPAAEMTVKTVYREETGKTYTPISQSGSAILRSQVLGAILENERLLNLPGNREAAWITSANYHMQLAPGGHQMIDRRDCVVLTLVPKHSSPHLFTGTLWVDSKDFSIVQLQGVTSKSPSFITGPTQVMRQYALVSGYAQATHARAESDSFLFGKTIVKIDYSDYQVQLRPTS
jgi:outer membrane lipoprotein-sorting protein